MSDHALCRLLLAAGALQRNSSLLLPNGRDVGNFRRKGTTRRFRHPVHLGIGIARGRCRPSQAGGRDPVEVGNLVHSTEMTVALL